MVSCLALKMTKFGPRQKGGIMLFVHPIINGDAQRLKLRLEIALWNLLSRQAVYERFTLYSRTE